MPIPAGIPGGWPPPSRPRRRPGSGRCFDAPTATHAAGHLLAFEPAFVPPTERRRVVREARVFVALYALAVGLAVVTGSTALVWL